jgi:hypothetical protein
VNDANTSVTVSIAADTSGMFRLILRVRRVARLTSRGRTVECAGTRRTSSNVRAFWMTRMFSPGAKRHYTLLALPAKFAATVLCGRVRLNQESSS